MENNQKRIEDTHQVYNEVVLNSEARAEEKYSKTRFPYEFFLSPDKGWTPCDILEVDTEKELAKVICYHPDSVGWMETCMGGLFDTVVPMWRVRLRED